LKYKTDLEKLYYYAKKSQSEIDFILQNEFDSKIYPIEVKAGSKDNIPIIFKSFIEDYEKII
jgi:predicted AAA+ superfamily ATPase